MKPPWYLLYRLTQRLDEGIEKAGFGYSSKLVGGIIFVAIFVLVTIGVWLVRLLAPGSQIDLFFKGHFDAVLMSTVGLFVIYYLCRTFWDSFWDNTPGVDK